jgi:hypothetical protein
MYPGQGSKGDNTSGVFVTQVGATPPSVTGNDAGAGASRHAFRDRLQRPALRILRQQERCHQPFLRGYAGQQHQPADRPGQQWQRPGAIARLWQFGWHRQGNHHGGHDQWHQCARPADQPQPEAFFFANATTMYVADSGSSKQTSASSSLGDGGLQKWSLVNGAWQLDYTVSAGLNLSNKASAGSTACWR